MLKSLWAINEITATRKAEQTQIHQVTTKDTTKVEAGRAGRAGKSLAEYNQRKREESAQLVKAQSDSKLIYYGAEVVVAIRASVIIGYYVYQLKTPKETLVNQTNEPLVHRHKETPAYKFEID